MRIVWLEVVGVEIVASQNLMGGNCSRGKCRVENWVFSIHNKFHVVDGKHLRWDLSECHISACNLSACLNFYQVGHISVRMIACRRV